MKRINKKMGKNKNKRLCLGIFVIIMLLFVPVSAYASEIKSDGKTTHEQSSNILNGVVLAQNSVSEKKMTLQSMQVSLSEFHL